MKRFFIAVFLLLGLFTFEQHRDRSNFLQGRKAILFYRSFQSAAAELEPFQVGSLGNFPYYWRDPRTLEFNEATYRWINSNLKSNTKPVQLDQSFTNLYMDVLSKVTYSLSSTDQAHLDKLTSHIADHQLAILETWKEVYGTLPGVQNNEEIIDKITQIIVSQWADPSTTLETVQHSTNIHTLLNNTPASGKRILPEFIRWVNAVNTANSFANDVSLNNAYINRALNAVQKPSAENGGMRISDSTGFIRPAYRITTPLHEVLSSLNSKDNKLKFSVSLLHSSGEEYNISIKGYESFRVSADKIFSLIEGDPSEALKDQIPVVDSPAEILVTLSGVAMINFGPVPFDKATGKSWYWIKPIQDAIKNGDKDVSGFKFSPKPQIDFSKEGPFGFLTGVLIARDVSFKVIDRSSALDEDDPKTGNKNFKEVPLLPPDNNGSGDEPTLSFTASENDTINSTAFIIGVRTSFPAASN